MPLVQILALPLSGCVPSLHLSFFFCKMGIIMVPTLESRREEETRE